MREKEQSSLLSNVATELEAMRSTGGTSANANLRKFPPFCFELLTSLPGNDRCIDCGASHPDWASVSYGVLMCVVCSGKHRSLGCQTSKVRSISMDHWSHSQVLSMLEGGNNQLQGFFKRHALLKPQQVAKVTGSTDMKRRYKTNCALFYREQLTKHVSKVINGGVYKGREVSRRTLSSPLKSVRKVLLSPSKSIRKLLQTPKPQ